MNSRPRLIVTEETHRSDWESLTWERRQGYRDRDGRLLVLIAGADQPAHPGMTAAELIVAMGALWVHHPDVKERPRQSSLLPMRNLAGVQPMISEHHMSLWRLMMQTIRFALS